MWTLIAESKKVQDKKLSWNTIVICCTSAHQILQIWQKWTTSRIQRARIGMQET